MTTETDTLYKVREEAPYSDTERLIPVAEIFGPTLQGEGALAGLSTYFVRTGGCDFACSWCDSGHAVNPEEVRTLPRMSQALITANLLDLETKHPGPEWLTLSGGNPALHDLSLVVLDWQNNELHLYKSDGAYPTYKVAVETQGTKWQPWFADVNLLTVSPKPPSSGMVSKQNIDNFMDYVAVAEEANVSRDRGWPYNFWQFVFKVVVFDEDDYQFARDLHRRYPLIKFYLSCGTAMGGLSGKWVPPLTPNVHDRFRMPRAYPGTVWTPHSYVDTVDSLLTRYRWLADRMKGDSSMADVAAFPQLHALTWGIDTRGV